jgi:phage-related protein
MKAWTSTAADIATVIMALTVIVFVGVLIPVALKLRKAAPMLKQMLDKFYDAAQPIIRHADAIADNVEYISTSVRVDIQQVSKTVAAANQSLMRTVEAAEDRVNQLNALLEVVQEEAESAFVTTASTIRGVKTGIHTAFEREELDDDEYSEAGADDDAEPKPRIKPRDRAGREP